ncbi:hypothetical protein ACOMHN_032704 [Nucella lapillus]
MVLPKALEDCCASDTEAEPPSVPAVDTERTPQATTTQKTKRSQCHQKNKAPKTKRNKEKTNTAANQLQELSLKDRADSPLSENASCGETDAQSGDCPHQANEANTQTVHLPNTDNQFEQESDETNEASSGLALEKTDTLSEKPLKEHRDPDRQEACEINQVSADSVTERTDLVLEKHLNENVDAKQRKGDQNRGRKVDTFRKREEETQIDEHIVEDYVRKATSTKTEQQLKDTRFRKITMVT